MHYRIGNFECGFYGEEEFFAAAQALLDDAIGLLMNHEQHEDEEWIADYEELIRKYVAYKGFLKFF